MVSQKQTALERAQVLFSENKSVTAVATCLLLESYSIVEVKDALHSLGQQVSIIRYGNFPDQLRVFFLENGTLRHREVTWQKSYQRRGKIHKSRH